MMSGKTGKFVIFGGILLIIVIGGILLLLPVRRSRPSISKKKLQQAIENGLVAECKELCSRISGDEVRVLPPSDYPLSIKLLSPVEVTCEAETIKIVLWRLAFKGQQIGFLVQEDPPGHTPSEHRYWEKVAPNIYAYYIPKKLKERFPHKK